MAATDIILGYGVFSIGNVDIALSRGGGSFQVEETWRHIEADGDRGPVKGRTVLDSSVPKLTVNVLEILPSNLPKMYPGTTLTTVAGTDTLTGKFDIGDADYNTVKWTGKTASGRSVIITVDNATNLENFDWALADKDEIIPSLTYTGHYLETARNVQPWKIEFVDGV